MAGSLATTNVLIGVMMAMSVLQTLLIIGAGIMGFTMYRRVTSAIREVDPREVRQAVMRVNAILDEVKTVLERVNHDVERVESVVHSAIDAAEAVGINVRAKTRWVVGAGRGLGVLFTEILKPRQRSQQRM